MTNPTSDRHREAAREIQQRIVRIVMGAVCQSPDPMSDEELTAILAKHFPSPSSETEELVAQARLEEFLLMKHKRPMDPTYFDMHHHEANLREALRKAEAGRKDAANVENIIRFPCCGW